MPDRRLLLIGTLAFAASPALAQQDSGPLQLVRRFYRPGFDEQAMPLSRTLRQLFAAALARSKREQEVVAGLDFAWTTFSQDSVDDIERTLVLKTIAQTLGNAVVEARFQDRGPRLVQYRLVKEDGRWVIDDIEYPAARERLSRLLAKGAKGES